MAETLHLDDGILELDINGRGLLRFNASDFNVYQRFIAIVKELPEMEKKYMSEVEQPDNGDELELAAANLNKAREIDRQIKERLSEAFGQENDFDNLLGGVNLMAFGRNGERVITNLLNALTPYIERGVKQHMKDAAADAVAYAEKNRAQRRAEK